MAGLELSEVLVPKEVRDHLHKLEKDWGSSKKTQTQQNTELSKTVQVADAGKVSPIGRKQPVDVHALWIPIPVWTIKTKSGEYKATDPEWKEFVKLEGDPKRVKALKAATAKAVATAVLDQLPSTALKAWGFDEKVKFDTGHIDFVFPFGPPPIYERPGLMITSTGLRLANQKLPDDTGRRYYRIFHPAIFAQAFWAGGKAFCQFYYARAVAKATKLLAGDSQNRLLTTLAKSFKGYTAAQQAQLKDAFTVSRPSTLIDPTDSAALLKLLLPSPDPQSALAVATKAYKRKQTTLQVAKLKECPRGGCFLTGYVDVIGSKATVRVTMKAVYIPSQDIFLGTPTVGEAIVMPKVAVINADKVKSEKSIKDMIKTTEDKIKIIEEEIKVVVNKSKPRDENVKGNENTIEATNGKVKGAHEDEIKLVQSKLEKPKTEGSETQKPKQDQENTDQTKDESEQSPRSEK